MSSFSRIFLVDDNEMDNVFHEVILRRAGFAGEILMFEMAQHALDYLRADQASTPTLIFLDINMPAMDGFEFAGKAEPLLQCIPATTIVMLSSSAADRDMKRAASLAVISGYIVKPLSGEIARELISGNLDSARFK